MGIFEVFAKQIFDLRQTSLELLSDSLSFVQTGLGFQFLVLKEETQK